MLSMISSSDVALAISAVGVSFFPWFNAWLKSRKAAKRKGKASRPEMNEDETPPRDRGWAVVNLAVSLGMVAMLLSAMGSTAPATEGAVAKWGLAGALLVISSGRSKG